MPLWERQKVQNLLHEKVSHCDDEGVRMPKKKPTSAAKKTKLIADQAVGLAEFAATALVAAEQLQLMDCLEQNIVTYADQGITAAK